MDWIGGAVEAAGAGHDVVMTPTTHCYFDYYQSTNQAAEPRAIGGFLPLDKVYSTRAGAREAGAAIPGSHPGRPGQSLDGICPLVQARRVHDLPAPLRAGRGGLVPKASRNYADFARRLQTHLERLDQLGVNYRKGE